MRTPIARIGLPIAMLATIAIVVFGKAASFRVTVHVLKTRVYCGGAAPTQELLDKLSTPTPISGMKLFVKKGSKNASGKAVAALVSDAAGVLKVDLPRGSYCLVEESKTKPLVIPTASGLETWDASCLRKRWETCDYSLQVTSKREDVSITYPEYCPWNTPCMTSRAPLPPDSNPLGSAAGRGLTTGLIGKYATW